MKATTGTVELIETGGETGVQHQRAIPRAYQGRRVAHPHSSSLTIIHTGRESPGSSSA